MHVKKIRMNGIPCIPYVKQFADRFACEMAEQKNGEHWFHTDEDFG